MKKLIISVTAVLAILLLCAQIAAAKTDTIRYTTIQAQGKTLRLTPGEVTKIKQTRIYSSRVRSMQNSIVIGTTIKNNETADLIIALYKKV